MLLKQDLQKIKKKLLLYSLVLAIGVSIEQCGQNTQQDIVKTKEKIKILEVKK